MRTSKAGKWIIMGYTKEQRDLVYERLRSRAKTIITDRHKKEYLKVLKNLIKKHLNKIKKENKTK